MKDKKTFLARSVLASTIFCLFPLNATAFTIVIGSQQTPQTCAGGTGLNPSTGFLLFGGSVLTVCSPTTIGTTIGDSIDNDILNSGSVIFQDSATVQGVVGGNVSGGGPINTMSISGGAGTTVLFQSTVNANSVPFIAGATATTNIEVASGQTFTGSVDNATGTANIGNLILDGSNTVIGVIGNTLPINQVIIACGGETDLTLNVTASKILFTAPGATVNFSPGMTYTANIDSTNAGSTNVVNFDGSVIFKGNVGLTNPIGTLNIRGGAGDFVEFSLAGATINPGTGGINFDGANPTAATELIFDSNITINGNVGNTTGNPDIGTLFAENGVTFNGAIGGAAANQTIHQISLLNANAKVSFNGNINVGTGNLVFLADNQTASFANGTTITITGNIDNPGPNVNDIVQFLGNATVNGIIGLTNPVSQVTLETAGKTVTFANTVNADAINFAGAASTTSTFDVQSGVAINGKIDNTTGTSGIGTVIFEGSNTYTKNIGQTLPIFAVTTTGSPGIVSFDGTINATNINVNGTGNDVTFKNDVTVTNFNVNGDNSIVTANDNVTAITAINVAGTGSTATFNDITNAATINISGAGSTATFNVDVTGTTLNVSGPSASAIFNKNNVNIPSLNFSGNADMLSKMEFADDVNVTGNINNTTGTSDKGTVLFDGRSKVSGTIGVSNSVHQVALAGPGNTVDFLGNINVGSGNLLFTNTATNTTTARIENNVTITGNVDSQVAANGAGILQFVNGGSILGTIGAGNGLTEVQLRGAGGVLFGGSVLNKTPINFYANATANFVNGVTVDGNIDNKTAATTGTVQFQGDAIVNGDIGFTKGLTAINILGAGNTVTFNNSIFNNTPIIFLADGNASIKDGETIFDVDNKTGMVAGTLILQGGATVQNVGATTPLKLVSVNTLGGIKTANFTGSQLNADTINIVGAGGTTINLNNPAGGVSVFGNFTTNNNGIDVLNIEPNGNALIDGSIGAPANRYAQVNINKAGITAEVIGDIYANNIQFQQAGTTLKIGDGFSAIGPISTAIPGEGGVTFLGSSTIGFNIGQAGIPIDNVTVNGPAGTTVNLNANVFADTFDVNNGGTLSVGGSPTITANVDVSNGVLSLVPNSTLNVNGDFTLNTANATLKLDMAHNLTSTGHVVATGQAFVAAPGNLSIVNAGFSPNQATVIPIVNGGAGSVLAPLNIVTPNSFLTTFTTQVNPVNPNELDLIITSKSLANVADQSNTIGVGGALDEIALSGVPLTGTLENIIEQLNTFPDAASLNFALSTLAPLVDGAVTQESFMAQRMVYDSIAERIDREHFWSRHKALKENAKGIAFGDSEYPDSSGWVRAFHLHANQQKRQKIAGYKDDMWGLVVGGDTMLTDEYMVGAALSWANLDLQHDLLPWMKTRVNSYQATVYGSLEWECPWFFNGSASIAYNDYETQRHITFGSVSVFPVGDYHGWQGGFAGEAGYIFGQGNFHAIPLANLFYSHLRLSSYQEKGADTADQIIQSSQFNSLLGGIGFKLVEDYDANYQRVFQSEGHAMVYYAFINDRMETTSQFVGAGPDFKTLGFKPARLSYNLGASLSLFSKANWTFKAGYDFDIKENYTAHAGQIRARYDW